MVHVTEISHHSYPVFLIMQMQSMAWPMKQPGNTTLAQLKPLTRLMEGILNPSPQIMEINFQWNNNCSQKTRAEKKLKRRPRTRSWDAQFEYIFWFCIAQVHCSSKALFPSIAANVNGFFPLMNRIHNINIPSLKAPKIKKTYREVNVKQ